MNKKKILLIVTGLFAAIIIAVLSFSFHQEPPKNTIRILVEKPLDQNHPRISPLLAESHYAYVSRGEDFDLIPEDLTKPQLHFQVVRDENTRALIFLKQDADVLYDNLSIAKTEWIRRKMPPKRIKILSSRGDAISQLALNEENPFLANPVFQKKIREALPIQEWMDHVFLGWVDPVAPDPTPLKVTSLHRITLRYLSTPTREGQQLAYLTREALKKIGIDVHISIYEPALFYARIRNRDFDLFSSTSLPGMKNILHLPHTVLIPLFQWKHGLILNSRIQTDANVENAMDYSFRFLSHLQLQ